MTVGQDEPDNQQGQGQKINPNWNPLLEQIPESLHTLIIPTLQEWDKGVQEKIQDLHSQYDPYKDLAKQGVDREDIERAFALQAAINENPADFIQNAVEYFQKNDPSFKLSLAQQDQLNNMNPDSFVDLNDEDIDVDALRKDPRFKDLFNSVDQANQFMEEYRESEEDAEAEEELEDYLEELHEQHGDFDDMYVMALITQDVDGEAAVKQFQSLVNQAATALQGGGAPNPQQQMFNQQQNTNQPPKVMGQGGSVGSGLPDKQIKMGDLSDGAVKDLVKQMLEANQTT